MIGDFFRKDLKNFKTYEVCKDNYKVRMDANESFFNFPKELNEQMLKVIESFLFNRYPEGEASEVCSLYAQYAKVQSKNVMAGNGSDELIQIVVNTFITAGDKVVTLSPDFSMYVIYTKIAGGIPVEIPLDEEFKLETEALISRVNKEEIKILFLSNPNNPTGGIIPREDITRIIEGCKCIVVIDEAYFEFYGKTIVDKIDSYENLIVLRTCSKGMGLAALRLGFLITNDILMEELKKVKPPFNVNSITQSIASIILKNQVVIKENVECIIKERDYLSENLRNMEGIKTYPSQGNFILIKVKNVAEIKEKLLAHSINIRSFKNTALKNCLRITVGTRAENDSLLTCIL